MKSRKSWHVCSPLLLIVLALVSSCGSPASPGAAGSAANVSGAATASGAANASVAASAATQSGSGNGEVTIVHWQHHFEARAKIVQELAKEFQQANPNIKIDFQSIPYNDYFQKIGPSLEAGTGPDVFQIPGPLMREFYDRKQLTPVPEDVYSTAQIEQDFVDWTIQLGKQEGKYVGLPTDVQSFLVFYNDDLFKQAGLDPSKDFASLDELAAAAEKLTKRNGNNLTQAGVDITTSPYQWYWSLLMAAFDNGIVDPKTLKVTYDNETGYGIWTWLTDLVTKHKVDSPEFLAGQDKFGLGKAAITMHEYTYAGNLKAAHPNVHFSAHLLPALAGRPKATAGTNWAYVVSNQSKHPAEAWAWIKFLTSQAAEQKWIAGGGELPSRKALYDDAALGSDPVTAAGLDSMKVTKPFNAYGWDDVYNIQQAVWDNVVLNGKDVKSAVHDAAVAEEKLYQDKKLKPAQ